MLILLLLLMILISCGFAATTYSKGLSQMIAGFIDTNGKEYLDFSVTTETVANARIDYGDGNNHQYYYGINLDVNDKDNNIRYLIAPNSTGDLGLKIGSFKLYASHKYFTLTLSHPSLTHTTDNQTTLDYRIGLRFKMLGGEIMQFSDSAQGQNRNLTDRKSVV